MHERVEVWGDVRCPWCWIGHRRLAQARAQLAAPVAVRHRSFLLEPHGPERPGRTVRETAVADWGMSASQWGRSSGRIRAAAEAAGLEIRIDTTPVIDSRPAHRLLALARHRGLDEDAARERVFAALLRDNRDVSRAAVVRDLGADLGLDGADVEAIVTTDAFADDVRTDHDEALRRGIRTVPAVVTARDVLQGDQSVTELVEALRAPTGIATGAHGRVGDCAPAETSG